MELEDHVPVYILEPKHPEDLVAAEDEAPLEAYITERLLLTTPTPRVEVKESSVAATARQPGSTMARRFDYSLVDTMDTRGDHAVVRAQVEILRKERIAYEQESIETRQALYRFEAYSRALEARACVDILEETGSSA
ncbi:hypothetical protein Tco_0028028 [Tanacetum coccineum]